MAWFAGGAVVGAIVAWIAARGRAAPRLAQLTERLAAEERRASEQETAGRQLEQERDRLRYELGEARTAVARLEAELKAGQAAAAEKLQLLERARADLQHVFREISAAALKENAEQFLARARREMETVRAEAAGDLEERRKAVEGLVAPVREALGRLEAATRQIESLREGAYRGLLEQVQILRQETGTLSRALSAPQTRGQWGELQLRRVVELAGMLEHCDFSEQVSAGAEDRLRPDMVIHLPEGRQIVVDAKTPIAAYLDAMAAADDATRSEHLARHARHVREKLRELSQKSYWERFQPTPNFVVMFLPGESFLSAAFQQDPTLIEDGFSTGVIPATPTILIGLLKTIAHGWRQKTIEKTAQQIAEWGRELYNRLATVLEHFDKEGDALRRAVESHNRCVASLDSRLLPMARRFAELDVATGLKDPTEPSLIDLRPNPPPWREAGTTSGTEAGLEENG